MLQNYRRIKQVKMNQSIAGILQIIRSQIILKNECDIDKYVRKDFIGESVVTKKKTNNLTILQTPLVYLPFVLSLQIS